MASRRSSCAHPWSRPRPLRSGRHGVQAGRRAIPPPSGRAHRRDPRPGAPPPPPAAARRLRRAGAAACDRPRPSVVSRRARPGVVRRLCRPLHPPADAAGQRRDRAALPHHRPRPDLARRQGRLCLDHRRPRCISPDPRGADRDSAPGPSPGRPAALAHRPLRHEPGPGRGHRVAGAPDHLRAPPPSLPLRPRHLQDRLGARRPHPVV